MFILSSENAFNLDQSKKSSFGKELKKKLTNAHTWLSLYKSIINIKEICIHKFNLPKFRCSNSMHFSYEITQSTKRKKLLLLLGNLTKVIISLGLA